MGDEEELLREGTLRAEADVEGEAPHREDDACLLAPDRDALYWVPLDLQPVVLQSRRGRRGGGGHSLRWEVARHYSAALPIASQHSTATTNRTDPACHRLTTTLLAAACPRSCCCNPSFAARLLSAAAHLAASSGRPPCLKVPVLSIFGPRTKLKFWAFLYKHDNSISITHC